MIVGRGALAVNHRPGEYEIVELGTLVVVLAAELEEGDFVDGACRRFGLVVGRDHYGSIVGDKFREKTPVLQFLYHEKWMEPITRTSQTEAHAVTIALE